MTATRPAATRTRLLRDKLGLCQWFHFEAYEDVERTAALMQELGCRHLRTGISWADYHRPGGEAWYDWQMKTLADAGLEVLLSVWHTPPSLAEGGVCAGPPRRLQDFADFIDLVIRRYEQFDALELWNEPNNRYKWNFSSFDPRWQKFGQMVAMAANWAKQCGKTTVLGGMIPVDPHWLDLIHQSGAMRFIDVVAIHGFPGMWWSDAPNWEWYQHWKGWDDKVQSIADGVEHRPVWITETGLATWDLSRGCVDREQLQIRRLNEAAAAPVERVYWYCLVDLCPEREAIEGFHVDENEYHMGLVTYEGQRKPAFEQFAQLMQTPVADLATPAPKAR